jgi:hypothetical protein
MRRRQLRADYIRRRERYHQIAQERGFVYDQGSITAAVRARLTARGHRTVQRQVGQVHTFAFIPRDGWHPVLYNDLHVLGQVTEFDFKKYGVSQPELAPSAPGAAVLRERMNARAFDVLREAHAKRPVDWAFLYGNGRQIGRNLVQRIIDELGIPVVTMCLDDKQSWDGALIGDQREGQVDLAAVFDLAWTSARVACEWYLVEGGRPLYLPEGFDQTLYRPLDVERDIPVSFIGDAYGFRPAFVERLRRAGVPLSVFGNGWGTRPVFGEEQVQVINRSSINLGSGGIGYDEHFTNVKTRDFEMPGTGGGIYLTSYSADLAQHYDIGREIICYGSDMELVELIRYYLRHPEEGQEIARRGRQRCLAEHRWLHRYQTVLRVLGVLGSEE